MFGDFITHLALFEPETHCVNPYSYRDPLNAGRRHNLNLYLTQMAQLAPSHLLIGEAPGYRGCRLTGIPFVSPAVLEQTVVEGCFFGKERGYQPVPEWPHIRGEATATIMWQVLQQAVPVPLLWNIFPFHPYEGAGCYQSNRRPGRQEIEQSRPLFEQLLALFPKCKLIAVGRQADHFLTNWGLPHEEVRHPSYGGKRQFTRGLKQLLAGY